MSVAQRQSITEELRTLSLGRTVIEFLDYLVVEAGLAENTILAYGRDLRDFAGFCQANGINTIEQVIPTVVQKYLCDEMYYAKSENSAKRALAAIRMLLRFAKLTGKIEGRRHDVLETPKTWPEIAGECATRSRWLSCWRRRSRTSRSTCATRQSWRCSTRRASGQRIGRAEDLRR